MVKAFLSHSSVDKQIVRKIKSRLQRIWTYFDEDCFEAGTDFRTAITEHLADTNLFVLFVSYNSLQSSWVKFEIDEAYWQTIKRNNLQVLVLSLEDIPISSLPTWMIRGKFETVTSPQLAAQIIKNMLLDNLSIEKRVYLGRENDIKKFYEDIETSEPIFPNIIAITGLNGIGRRTFIKDILSKRFSLDYTTEFYLDESESLLELYRKLLDDNISDNSPEKINELYKWFTASSATERANEVARILSLYTVNHTCPIIVDNDSMLNNAGFYKDDFLDVLRCFAQNYTDHYLTLVHTRLPKLGVTEKQLVYLCRLYALNDVSSYAIFDSLLKRNSVPILDTNQVKEIAKYLDGYPPAIINAVRECKLDGVDIVCNDKKSLIDFQSRLFSKYLDKIPLSENENQLLTVVNNVGNVTILVLAAIMEKSADIVATSLKVCHDYNIIEQRSNGTYSISPPMHMAVYKKYPQYDQKMFSSISKILIDKFWKPDSETNFVIIDIIINTVLCSGQEDDLQKFKNFILPSHLLKAAEKENRATNWALAEKYARKAIELDSQLNDAHVLLFKTLVRQETSKTIVSLNAEEETILSILKKSYDIRHYYLEGFRAWKRHKYYDAIEIFKLAIHAGEDSIPTHRDLAECYYQTNQIEEAQKEINLVTGTRKINNPFILDLASKIAISLGNLELAEESLAKQEIVDRYENIEHRRATYFMKLPDYDMAYVHSTNACNGDRVLPEMHLLRMNIAIHLRKFEIVEMEHKLITENYKYYSYDTCETLYTTMLLLAKGWKTAEASFAKISNKTNPLALDLKFKILDLKLNDSSISPLDKKNAELEKFDISKKKTVDILNHLQCYDLH